ncbi:MAG: hypothetical protein ACTJGR_03535 [Pauljensenia sp.]
MPSDPPTIHTPDPEGAQRPVSNTDDELLVPFGAPVADASGGEGDAPPAGPASGSGSSSGGRGRRRRARSALRPLWWSMPVVIVLALVATFLTGLHVWSAASARAYQDTGYDRARSGFEGQLTWTRSGPEAWVADYNLGSTLLVQGYLDVGVAHLERAMETVPRATEVAPGYIESYSYECRVRTNLALGLEGQGDAQAADLQWAGAADLYERSSDLLSPCRSIDTSQSQSGDPQSGDPQSGAGGGQSGEPQSGQEGGGQSGEPQSGAGGSGEPSADPSTEPSEGEGGSGEPSADPSTEPSGGSSGEPSSDPSGQTGAGEQGDPGEEAESAKDRLDGKARDARDRAEGRSPSPQPSGDPSSEPSEAPTGEPTSGSSPEPTPSGDSSGDPTPTPSASPTPDPFGNETDQQRERRQELQRQLERSNSDQGNTYDQNRSGSPNGGW